jgi:amidase
VTFETIDACCGTVRSVEQFMQMRQEKRRCGPLTGPVFVEDARPGDTLVVEVVKVKLDDDGFQLIGPNRAIVQDEVPDWTCYVVSIKGDRLQLPNGIELPIDPVIGTFGNAPAGEPVKDANRLGGNQDIPAVCTGARLYLPVEVDGALFSLGDVHACQGDGEVVGAPEIGAQVTVRISVQHGEQNDWCMIEDDKDWHTACPGSNEYEAARQAVFHNARFISRTYGIEFKDALIILTMIGRVSISRTGAWGQYRSVVCSSFSKQVVENAVAKYRTGA